MARDFETFFGAEYRSLCRALVLLVGDTFEAEELAQETMTRMLERWDRVGAMESPTGYAYRTALNLQRKRTGDWPSARSDGSHRFRPAEGAIRVSIDRSPRGGSNDQRDAHRE